MAIGQRIKLLLQSKKIRQQDLAIALEMSRQNVSSFVNGNSEPTIATLNYLLRTYTDLNARWLLTGDGNMFTENENQTNNKDLTDYIKTLEKDCEICKEKEKRIGAMDKQISTLEEMVEVLRGR